MHLDGWLCEIKDAQIRDGLHILGRAPAGAGAGRHGARDAAGAADVVGHAGAAGPAGGAGSRRGGRCGVEHRRRPGRGTGAQPRRRDGEAGLGRGRGRGRGLEVLGEQTDDTVVRILRFAATEVVPRLGRTTEEIDGVLHALDGGHVPAGPSRLAAARAGQRAPDRPELLLHRPARDPVAARVGDRADARGLPARALPRGPRRRVAHLRRPVAVGDRGDAHERRRHRRGARADGRAAGVGRGVAAGDRARGHPDRRARPAPRRRRAAHLRLLPRRVPARGGDDGRRGAAGGGPRRRRTRTTSSPPTPARTRRRVVVAAGDDADLRLAARRVRGGPAAGDGLPGLAGRRRPRRDLHDLGRARLRARPAGRVGASRR